MISNNYSLESKKSIVKDLRQFEKTITGKTNSYNINERLTKQDLQRSLNNAKDNIKSGTIPTLISKEDALTRLESLRKKWL